MKPIELQQAISACDEAWKLYDYAIDNESKEMISERFKVCRMLEARKSELYAQWQAVGGTSEVETLTAVELATKLEIQHLTLNPQIGEMVQSTQRLEMLVKSGAVDANGNLKPYIPSGHKSVPLTLEELGDDGQVYPY